MIYYIIIGVLIVICIYLYIETRKVHEYNRDIDAQNVRLSLKNNELVKQQQDLQGQVQEVDTKLAVRRSEMSSLDQMIESKSGELQRITSQATTAAQNQQRLSRKAFENYADALEFSYQEKDREYDSRIKELQDQVDIVSKDLATISATRAARRAALQKEQEVKDNKDNYRLIPSSLDLDDIHKLEIIKKDLHKPRILSMLIWSTFWQPLAKVKFPQIIQNKTAMGIYKITNTLTDECYVGQSVDIYKRWTDHCKCGLGIDTPPGNKLYKAIQDYGLENFTFEVVAECPREELDAKEKYFIKLYEADTFGYNSKQI